VGTAIESLANWRTEKISPKRGLPAFIYTDESIFARECETILSKTWVFVGFAHSLAKPGDVQPTTVGGRPILLVRDKGGNIATFHNVCRHRCAKLVEKPTNVGPLIRCPYHSWAYGLDGALRSSPHFGGIGNHTPDGFNPADHGLIPVRTAVWHDWIFVNLSGAAKDFEIYARPLVRRLYGIDFDKVVPVATLEFGEVAANWKFIMENFIEPYHVQFVHQTTTSQPLKDHKTIVDGVCLGSSVDLPEEIGIKHRLGVSSRYLTLFPTFILGRYVPDQIGVYLNVPLGPGRTSQTRVIYKTDGSVPEANEISGLKNLWWDVHMEDHAICERLQMARASPVAISGGVLSPCWEDSVRAFQELVVDCLDAE
jgi:nitrite reductase/ring-hydroxylating ferredoxin subunit